MNSRVDILTLGFCNVDYLAIVPHIPLDEKVQIIETIEQSGGSAATAAVTAARLGARAGFIGRVGDDRRGRTIVDEFRSEGVNIDGLAVLSVRESAEWPCVIRAGICGVRKPSFPRRRESSAACRVSGFLPSRE